MNNCKWTKSDRGVKRIQGTATARPGYFAVAMNNSIQAEMTTTNHTALYRFTFPKNGKRCNKKRAFNSTMTGNQTATPGPMAPDPGLPNSPVILADLTDLSGSRLEGNISVDGDSGRIKGSGEFRPSFGIGTYKLHFCADFKGAEIRETGVFVNNRAGTQPKEVHMWNDQNQTPGGAFVQFHKADNNEILARVGVSFMSPEQACENAEKEIPDYDFEGVRKAAEDAWRKKLSTIKLDSTGISRSLLRTFWSGVYRTFLSPQDYTGENPLWKSDEPYFDSYYCIWDSFRSTHPLLTLVDPHAQALMVRSLIDIYRHEGKLPDCRMSLCKGYTQGGSNADNVLADSYLKGLRDGIDWDTGYEAVVSDAEVEPRIWTVEGRGGLHSWKNLGYIPTDDFDPYGVGIFTRSISRTVEYSYNDFCIAEMAREMGKTDDAEKYLKRSGNWINMFDAQSTSTVTGGGFKGFLQPRYLNGTFGFQEPAICTDLYHFTDCYLNVNGHETYEAGSWLYTFYIPHDQASLIPTLGGPDEYVRRLSYLHDTPGLFYIGDEQAYVLIYLFHYVARPGLSAKYAHKYMPGSFNDTVGGLPGNDDSGAMGSFSALLLMGIFPMSGQDVYLITPPFFKEVSIDNAITGKTATIRSKNFDPNYGNIYIQNATLDGKPYNKSWITHKFFSEGGVLELELGPTESTWGTSKDLVPPSASKNFWDKL